MVEYSRIFPKLDFEGKELVKNSWRVVKIWLHFGLDSCHATPSNYFVCCAWEFFLFLLINCLNRVGHFSCQWVSCIHGPGIYWVPTLLNDSHIPLQDLGQIPIFKALLSSALAPRDRDKINSVFLPDSLARDDMTPFLVGVRNAARWTCCPQLPAFGLSDSEGDLPCQFS